MKENTSKKHSDHKYYPSHHLHVLKQMAKPDSGQSTESKSGLAVPGSASYFGQNHFGFSACLGLFVKEAVRIPASRSTLLFLCSLNPWTKNTLGTNISIP